MSTNQVDLDMIHQLDGPSEASDHPAADDQTLQEAFEIRAPKSPELEQAFSIVLESTPKGG